MSKINRLRLALASGAFWRGFLCKPLPVDSTPNRSDFEQKSHDLWEKYRKLLREYGDNDARWRVLYEMHHRDLVRLIREYDDR